MKKNGLNNHFTAWAFAMASSCSTAASPLATETETGAAAETASELSYTSKSEAKRACPAEAPASPTVSPVVPVASSPDSQDLPAVAWGAGSGIVTWASSGSLKDFYIPVNSYGAPRASKERPLWSDSEPYYSQLASAVAFHGDRFLVVWGAHLLYNTPANYHEVRGRFISLNGTPIGNEFTISPPTDAQVTPSVAWTGTSFIVAWSYYEAHRPIHAVRIALDGSLLDADPIAVTPNVDLALSRVSPRIAGNGTGALLAWNEERNGEVMVRAARLLADGRVLDPNGFRVSPPTKAQSGRVPDVAWNGSSYLVVWDDPRDIGGAGGTDVFGARVTADGRVVDRDGFRIAGTPSEYEMAPRIAWDGTRFLVVWDQARSQDQQNGWGEVRGTFVSIDGCAADGAGFVITPNPTRGMFPAFPVIAVTDQTFVIAWSGLGANGSQDLLAASVSR